MSLTTLCIAWGLKYHYSIAHAENLKWILAPTAALVEIISGHLFYFEPDIGYINQDLRIIIAPACAGVNFLIAAFGMSFFCGIFKFSGFKNKFIWLAGCAIGAYTATISVNAVRIRISIAMITADIHAGWLTPERVHRMIGILIYFFFLTVFYHIIQKIICYMLANAPDNNSRPQMQKKQKNRIGRMIPIGILPLVCYWTIAIMVPWLNAAHKEDPAGYTEHSLTVGVLSFAVFLCFCMVRVIIARINIKKEKTPAFAGIVQKP